MPFTFFKSVSARLDKGKAEPLKGEPYLLKMDKCKEAKIIIHFYQYLNEPDLEITLTEPRRGKLLAEYDPQTGKWIHQDWLPEEEEEEKLEGRVNRKKIEEKTQL